MHEMARIMKDINWNYHKNSKKNRKHLKKLLKNISIKNSGKKFWSEEIIHVSMYIKIRKNNLLKYNWFIVQL